MAVDMGGGPSFMYAADAVAAYESFNSGRQAAASNANGLPEYTG